MIDPLRRQYQRFPYPPIPALALPRYHAEFSPQIRFEWATERAYQTKRSHYGISILVIGAGTLEALVVAQAHPGAAKVVALDFSSHSLRLLRRRSRWARLTRFLGTPQHARLETVCEDFWNFEPKEKFDFILASNVLHHLSDPAQAPSRFAHWLKPGGIVRVVTYPKQSRHFMRETSRYLRTSLGLSNSEGDRYPRDLIRQARRAIRSLPPDHPVRSCFESQPETRTRAGLIDAFLNARENPLSPIEWRDAFSHAGLELFIETQTDTSRSKFVDELLPGRNGLSKLDAWDRLQILDDTLELCANPVLWLKKSSEPQSMQPTNAANTPGLTTRAPQSFEFSSAEIHEGAERARTLLARADIRLEDYLAALRAEVGPRVTAPPEERPLPGLSLLDWM